MTGNMNIKLAIEIELTLEYFEDVIITALEGGSNYWYYLNNKEELDFPKNGKALSENIAYALYTNPEYKLTVNDAENPNDMLGWCTQKSMIRAFEKCANEDYSRFKSFEDGSFDAEDADYIFQLAVMDEVVFG